LSQAHNHVAGVGSKTNKSSPAMVSRFARTLNGSVSTLRGAASGKPVGTGPTSGRCHKKFGAI
jgi:hypothetical protein